LEVSYLLNRDSYVPYYLQIYNDLKSRINKLVYKPDQVLPSENELVEEFHVTRATIRNAIKKLKDEGMVRTEKGKGSFVNPPKIVQNLNKIYSIGRDFTEEGYKLERELIEIYEELPSSDVRERLDLEENEAVIVTKIVRGVEGIPVVFQMSYLPIKIVPEMAPSEIKTKTIYEVLKTKHNINLRKAVEYLDPIVADEYYSDILGVEINTPLFMTERITYGDLEKPVEYRKCVIRSDKFRFSVELR
jgi:GntR family transcriptional regulator